MSPAIALPPHTLSDTPTTRSITIGPWHVSSTSTTISDARALSALALDLPPPEMTFGANALALAHAPSGAQYAFRAQEALRAVRAGPMEDGDGGVQVGYAAAWRASRTAPDAAPDALPAAAAAPARPYDWTYTTTYAGHAERADDEDGEGSQAELAWTDADPTGPHAIPLAELTRPDPILFYAEVPLFEDELHDNGASQYVVRVRVMPTCIFVLARATLRVDGVLFRQHDTRLYHSFASSPPTLVRETSGWEAPYDRVARLLPNRDDRTPLTDPNFIGRALADLPRDLVQGAGANTGWRALGTRLQVATLDGKSQSGMEDLEGGVAKLDIKE